MHDEDEIEREESAMNTFYYEIDKNKEKIAKWEKCDPREYGSRIQDAKKRITVLEERIAEIEEQRIFRDEMEPL